MLNKPKEGEKREQFESLAKKKKIIWLFSWSFTLGQTAVAVINICITSWDLYPWRELNCHRQSWASKNSSRQAGRLAGWLAGRQPTLPLSPLDLISPEEALPPPTTPNYAPLWHCVCVSACLVWGRSSFSLHTITDATTLHCWENAYIDLSWSAIQLSSSQSCLRLITWPAYTDLCLPAISKNNKMMKQ